VGGALMVGDVIVKFVIQGPGGNSIALNREEAERLAKALKIALKSGKGSDVVIYPASATLRR
jgi:hypothetical protein